MTSFRTSSPPISLGVVVALVLALPLLLGGCNDGTINSPDISNDVFESYVALGNSITAGFQANGINANLQRQAYPVLLSQQMGTPFNVPSIPVPGCPPPVTNIFTGSLLGGPYPTLPCTLRETPSPSIVNNVAVPGAQVFDALSNLDPNGPEEPPNPSPSILTSLILGGDTQVEAAARANPTFASVWLGNNDVLGAGLAGVPAAATPVATFQNQYTNVLDQLQAAGAERGLLIGVADVSVIPHFSPGQAYGAAEQQINVIGAQSSDAWGHFEVLDSCAPGNPGANTLVPFVYGFGELFARAAQGETVELDCAPDSAPSNVLTPSEVLAVRETIGNYNARIKQMADSRGLAYIDPNPFLRALYQANAGDADPSNDLVPKFPNPQPGQPTFGAYFSEDGIHPTGELQRVIAYQSIEAINATYSDQGVNLEQVSIPSELQPLLE